MRQATSCSVAVMVVVLWFCGAASAQQLVAPIVRSPAMPSPTDTWRWPHQGVARVNQRTKEWLTLGAELRLRWETRQNAGFRRDNDDGYLLTRVRFNVDIHPGSWLKIFLEGQDAQVLGFKADPDPPAFQDSFDLRQAYLEFFHRRRKGLGLRVGRQELNFGDERLIGSFNYGNTARSFDAVRIFYDHARVRLDSFAAAVVRIEDGRFNRTADGDNLYGLHATFPTAIPKGRWDLYTFWRAQSRLLNEHGRPGDADRVTLGTRLAGTLPANFDYNIELVGQTGDVAGDKVRAGAVHALIGHTLGNMIGKPRLVGEYNFASGDGDPTDGKLGTFDQLFPTNHAKYGYADLVGWRNIHDLHGGVSVKPVERASVGFDLRWFWLASRRDAFYNAAGLPVARVREGARHRYVGREMDVSTSIKLTNHLYIEAAIGYLFAGDFLKQATPGSDSSYTYGMVSYRF